MGTKVQLQVRLHKALEFKNEDEENLGEEGTLFIKEVGNATIKSRVAFEYQLKSLD